MEVSAAKRNIIAKRDNFVNFTPIALPLAVVAIAAAVMSERLRIASSTLSLISMSIVLLERWRVGRDTPVYTFDEEACKEKIKKLAQDRSLTLSPEEVTCALNAFKEIRAFPRGRFPYPENGRVFNSSNNCLVYYPELINLFDLINKNQSDETIANQFCQALLSASEQGALADFPWIDGWKVAPRFGLYSDQIVNKERLLTWTFTPWLKDEATGKEYLFESKWLVRYKSYLLAIASPFVHLFGVPFAMVQSGWRLASGQPREGKGSDEVVRLFTAPLAYLGLEGSAIYGLFRPYEGRRLYAALERFLYDGPLLAPCFQPGATRHLFGSAIDGPEGM